MRLRERGYATELLAAEAERVVAHHAAAHRNRSLFLWLSLSAPHTPLQAPEAWLRRQPAAWDPLLRVYSAMVGCADAAVGSTVGALRRAGMLPEALVLFLSDNGGPVMPSVCNGGLRGGKGTSFDGGVRVPAFVHWPACLGGAPRAVHASAHMVDVFATLGAAAGAALSAQRQRELGARLRRLAPESEPLWPALSAGGSRTPQKRLLVLQVSASASAVLRGRWKLIVADRRCLALPRDVSSSDSLRGFDAAQLLLAQLPQRPNRTAAAWLRAARRAGAELQLFDVGRDPAEDRDLLQKPGRAGAARRRETAAALLGHYVRATRAAQRGIEAAQREGRLDSSGHLVIKWFAKQVEFCWAHRHWRQQASFLRLCVGREAERNVSRTVAGLGPAAQRRWVAKLRKAGG